MIDELKNLSEQLEAAGDYAPNSKELGLGYQTYLPLYTQLGLNDKNSEAFFSKMKSIYIKNEMLDEILKPLAVKEVWQASDKREIIKLINFNAFLHTIYVTRGLTS